VTDATLRCQPQFRQFRRFPTAIVRVIGRFRDDEDSPDLQKLRSTLRCNGRWPEGTGGNQVKSLDQFRNPGDLLDSRRNHRPVIWRTVPFEDFFKKISPFDHGIRKDCPAAPAIEEKQSGQSASAAKVYEGLWRVRVPLLPAKGKA
jgi:hypothetical protein